MIQTLLYDGLKYLHIHAIDVADNGIDALERLGEEHYKLVLIDCQMQDSSGYQIIDTMRDLRRTTPIIGVSDLTPQASQEKCNSKGMDAHLQKPLNFYALEEAIKQIFDIKTYKHNPTNIPKQHIHNSVDSITRNGTF